MSLSDLAAAETVCAIGGRAYRLAPLRVRDFAEMERLVLASRPDPLAVVRAKLDGLPDHLQRHLLTAAWHEARRAHRVSIDELAEWMNTLAGQVYAFWLSIRRNHPEITREEAEALYDQAQAEGGGCLGKRTGQARWRRRRVPVCRAKQSPGAACSTP